MVTNNEGFVALKRVRTINKIVNVGGEEYFFNTRANICMAWIRPEHVDGVLSIRRTCCGGSKKPDFRHANEDDVRRWTNGGGR
jgi:hypothetical protein